MFTLLDVFKLWFLVKKPTMTDDRTERRRGERESVCVCNVKFGFLLFVCLVIFEKKNNNLLLAKVKPKKKITRQKGHPGTI